MNYQQTSPQSDSSNGTVPADTSINVSQNDQLTNLGANQGLPVAPPATGLPAPSNSTQSYVPPVPQQPSVDSLTNKFSSESPATAEDVDLIEKEWVNKAKIIVEKTKNDPSQQNIQLNRFKADYLNTRFNKQIKPMDS